MSSQPDNVVSLDDFRKRKAAEKKKKKATRTIPWHPSMGTEPPKVNPSQFAKMKEWEEDE